MSTSQKRPERILRRLRENAETIEIELGGETLEFLLGTYGAKLAREQGHDPTTVVFSVIKRLFPIFKALYGDLSKEDLKKGSISFDLERITRLIDAATESVDTELLEDLSVVVWSGLLPFDPDLLLDEVQIMMSVRAIPSLIWDIYPKLVSFGDDLEAEGEAIQAKDEDDESEEESGN